MSRPYWSVRFVPTESALPSKLERGRAYFIGDKQVIIVDYGNGPITYGGIPGPQGAPGEPQPMLQGQIDLLAEASIDTTKHLFEVNQKVISNKKLLLEKIEGLDTRLEEAKSELSKRIVKADEKTEITSSDLQVIIADLRDELTALIESNSEATLDLITFVHSKFEKIESVISIVVKTFATLYPNADIDMNPDLQEPTSLMPGEIFATDSGLYKVASSYVDSDGSVEVILDVIDEALQFRISTLKDGDSVITGDHQIWKVSGYNIENEEGILTLSYEGTQRLIETLKAGDVVEYDGGSFTVTSAKIVDGSGVISLTLAN